MNDIWAMVHKERQALIDDLATLTDEQWNTPSLCDGWTVHDVLAHLVDDANTTRPGFFGRLLLAGFNFDRLNQKGVDRQRRTDPAATLEAFRMASDRTSSAPAPLASRLVEIIVHGEDIRRPLAILREYPTEAIIPGIEYQLETSEAVGGSKQRADGLQLVASDTDWMHGSGAVVKGPAIDLLMALTARPVPDGVLTGDGACILRGRRF